MCFIVCILFIIFVCAICIIYFKEILQIKLAIKHYVGMSYTFYNRLQDKYDVEMLISFETNDSCLFLMNYMKAAAH